MDAVQNVKELVQRCLMPEARMVPAGYQWPPPATREEIAQFEREVGFEMPASVHEWLQFCNGSLLGPGGTYGVGDQDGFLSMKQRTLPEWQRQRWLAAAGDGCGNAFVVNCNEGAHWGVVYFFEALHPDVPAYIHASSIWHGMQLLLTRELDATPIPPHARDSRGRLSREFLEIQTQIRREEALRLDPDLGNHDPTMMIWSK